MQEELKFKQKKICFQANKSGQWTHAAVLAGISSSSK
jgi:hypothetical protein